MNDDKKQIPFGNDNKWAIRRLDFQTARFLDLGVGFRSDRARLVGRASIFYFYFNYTGLEGVTTQTISFFVGL